MGRHKRKQRTEAPPPSAPGWVPRPRYAAALAAVVFLVFLHCRNYGFVWDDEQFIQNNVYLTSWSYFPRLFTENIVAGFGLKSNLYRPLQSVSHFLDVRVWGMDPSGHHLTNVLLQAGASAAVYAWLAEMASPPAALAAAALYSLHPLQSEAVAYVSGRGDTMAILFLCLGLMLFRRSLAASLACAAAAVLSKESLAMFPVLLLLSERASGRPIDPKRHAPFWVLSAVYAVSRLTVLNFQNTLNFYDAHNLLTDHFQYRLWTYLTTLPEGVRLWLWPVDLHHERSWPVYSTPAAERVWISALLVLGWLAVAARTWRSRPALSAGMLWFVLATIPTSNLFVVINALFYDHWFLIPGLGLALLAAKSLDHAGQARGPALAATALLAGACAAKARAQDEVWRDGVSLNSHILRFEPNNAKIHNNLAMALSDRGQYPGAIAHYQRAIQLYDQYPQTHHNLGRVYEQLGRLEEAEAEYRRAVEMDPRFYHSWVNLGGLALRRGDDSEAEKDFRRAVEAYPYASVGYYGLAEILLSRGDREGAIRELESGLKYVDDPRLRAAIERIRAARKS